MTSSEYNIIIDNYADNLFRFVLKNIKNEDDAKDIVQESFLKVWLKKEEINFLKAKSYLFSTAYHQTIDYVRKSKIQLVANEELNKHSLIYEDQFTDIQAVLHEALEKLPPIQKAVILLRDYEGYNYLEIAEITKLSEAQVKVYIFRGRTFLKNYLGSIEAVL
ncbi:MAG: RNA polymerase subunit sigma-24 [Flavobacteriales bacterium CG18_big_fil_WC_8_21_14_2_50_32_9]|nr:MAG: RNA polymerase subunit sigma-24 [Flavobacteriales bacterium CG18_big_fil_WC_8_21_14_2_50_32_9]PJC63178.1 MAG: RNA polymerase sigma factor [Flavobacteriales bacterium CG_4_9_14_0_2_um_filter_32_27]